MHLTAQQLAQRWHISEKTLERWRNQGNGPIFLKLVGRVLYPVQHIEALEAKRIRMAKTLDLGPFHWFGGEPNKPLPDLGKFAVAKHTKGNAQGVKLLKPNHRVVPLSAFVPVPTIAALAVKLFGEAAA